MNFPTHKLGSTLYLIFHEHVSKIGIRKCKSGPFISDHCAVEFWLNLEKPKIKLKRISYRKLMDIDVEKLENSLSLDELLENNLHIDNLVSEFESRIKKTFDSLAPMKNKQLLVRKMQLWFTSELKNQK